MSGVIAVDFEHPDETRSFARGRIDLVRVGPTSIARMSLEPGWHWAEDVKPMAGTDNCQNRHVGYMESGHLLVTMADGSQLDIGPGETYVIEPGHDAKVAGKEPVVALEFVTQTAEAFAKMA